MRRSLVAIGLLVLLLPAVWMVRNWQARSRSMPYQDSFARGSMREWTAYGGSWHLAGDRLVNNSDDSGAKVVTGSPDLRDYQIETDVQLLNNYGDAGVLLRVQRPEEGTNAFFGYYAGVRLPGELWLGQMDYGFMLLQQAPVAGGVTPGAWYHLIVDVRGCTIDARVNLPNGPTVAHAASSTPECMPTGSFGLRSFAAGGVWRNVRVRTLP